MAKKDYPPGDSSTYTSKTKQYNVRLPLEWVPLIEEASDNNAKFIRGAVEEKLTQLGLLSSENDNENSSSIISREIPLDRELILEKFPRPRLDLLYSEHQLKFNHLLLFNEYILSPDDIEVVFIDEPYKLPEDIAELRDEIIHLQSKEHFKLLGRPPKLEDEEILRLYDYKVTDNKLILYVQKTTYLNSLITNTSVDTYIRTEQTTIRQKYVEGPTIPSLKESKLSNQMGNGVILVTSDSKMVLQKRSPLKLYNPSVWIHSLGVKSKLQESEEFSISKMIEAGIKNEFNILSRNLKRIILLGAARDMNRGGNTDFYYLVNLSISFDEFLEMAKANQEKEGKWEWDRIKGIELKGDSDMNVEVIESMIEDYNFPDVTHMTFEMFKNYLKNGGSIN